jgi:hypothetical protein
MSEYKAKINDTDRGGQKNREINPTQCHFVHDKSYMACLRTNPSLRDEKLATNDLNYGTTCR